MSKMTILFQWRIKSTLHQPWEWTSTKEVQLTRISTGTCRHLLTRQVRMRRRNLPVGVTTFCEAFTAFTDET